MNNFTEAFKNNTDEEINSLLGSNNPHMDGKIYIHIFNVISNFKIISYILCRYTSKNLIKYNGYKRKFKNFDG